MAETLSASRPRLSVVLCSLNGAEGVRRCLVSLGQQTIADDLQVIVVDDGSSDGTSAVAESFGVTLLRHEHNRGLAAARNTGVRSAAAPIVAFLDDDCEATPQWAETLLAAYENVGDEVVGIGGQVRVSAPDGYMRGFLLRHNPLLPLELDLARSSRASYRLARYLARNWRETEPAGRRAVFSLVGANMSFRTDQVRELQFDESMTFGSEDLDMCLRVRSSCGENSLLFDPDVQVVHHFRPGIGDSLRRSRSYGRGHARMLRKYPDMTPTLFPLPVVSAVLLLAAARDRRSLLAVGLVPHLVHPQGLRAALRGRPDAVVDAYVSLLLEAAFLVGAFVPASRGHHRPLTVSDSGGRE